MIEENGWQKFEKALAVPIKEVLHKTDGSKDIYRYRKNNPKIYKYLLVGIHIENLLGSKANDDAEDKIPDMKVDDFLEMIEIYKFVKGKRA